MRPDSSQTSTAKRLTYVRSMLGLSQRELAAELRVAASAVALWETGKRRMPGPALKLLELYEQEMGVPYPEKDAYRPGQSLSWFSHTGKIAADATRVVPVLIKGVFRKILSGESQAQPVSASVKAALAKNIVVSMGELKGLSMKLGQMLNYMELDLSPEVRGAFEALQNSAPPVPADVIAEVLAEELGGPPRRIFSEWSAEPVASGSVGQVHRARLKDGQQVAVKVQYPKIAQAIESDLYAADRIDQMLSVFFRGPPKRGELVGEFGERFREECDYLREARTQEAFSQFDLPAGAAVPKVYPEHCTSRLLVSEFVEGQTFREFLATASQEQKNRAGEAIFDFTFRSIFSYRMFNCDPHPGNFLFRDGKVVFLDFGCARALSADTVRNLRDLMLFSSQGSLEGIRETTLRMGMVTDPERFDFGYHYRMLREIYEPGIEERVFRFDFDYVLRTWKMHFSENPNRFRTRVPKDWIFLMRVQWGLGALLAKLGAESNWYDRLYPLLESAPPVHDPS